MTAIEAVRSRPPSRVGLGWAFFERQTNLWKRYWAWELVWLVYGVVNTLAITFIANEAGRSAQPRRPSCPGSPCSCSSAPSCGPTSRPSSTT